MVVVGGDWWCWGVGGGGGGDDRVVGVVELVEMVVDFGEEEEDEVLGYVEIGGKEREIGDSGSGEGRWELGGAEATARAPAMVA